MKIMLFLSILFFSFQDSFSQDLIKSFKLNDNQHLGAVVQLENKTTVFFLVENKPEIPVIGFDTVGNKVLDITIKRKQTGGYPMKPNLSPMLIHVVGNEIYTLESGLFGRKKFEDLDRRKLFVQKITEDGTITEKLFDQPEEDSRGKTEPMVYYANEKGIFGIERVKIKGFKNKDQLNLLKYDMSSSKPITYNLNLPIEDNSPKLNWVYLGNQDGKAILAYKDYDYEKKELVEPMKYHIALVDGEGKVSKRYIINLELEEGSHIAYAKSPNQRGQFHIPNLSSDGEDYYLTSTASRTDIFYNTYDNLLYIIGSSSSTEKLRRSPPYGGVNGIFVQKWSLEGEKKSSWNMPFPKKVLDNEIGNRKTKVGYISYFDFYVEPYLGNIDVQFNNVMFHITKDGELIDVHEFEYKTMIESKEIVYPTNTYVPEGITYIGEISNPGGVIMNTQNRYPPTPPTSGHFYSNYIMSNTLNRYNFYIEGKEHPIYKKIADLGNVYGATYNFVTKINKSSSLVIEMDKKKLTGKDLRDEMEVNIYKFEY